MEQTALKRNAMVQEQSSGLVRKSAQLVTRWSPLGATSFAFASFLLKQEWMTALLLFPVTLVSGVWAAYSKGFIERMNEIYAERAKKDADSLVAWMDSLNEALKWQFSGFEAKYLKLQAKLCVDYETEGFNPDLTATLRLEKVFVELELSGFLPEAQRTNLDNLDIWQLLRMSRKDPTYRQMVIQAKGGFGKTTLLRHIALIYGQGQYHRHRTPRRIPFLLRLRDLRLQLAQDPLPTLPELITNHYLPNLAKQMQTNLMPPPKWAEQILHSGEALVMLDGFDELAESQRQRSSHWISAQMQAYEKTTFILTSRPTGYKDYVATHPTCPIFVKEFSPKNQELFIRRWYQCQERCARGESREALKQAEMVANCNAQNLLRQLQDPSRPELAQMAQNPLLLNMLATFHRFDPGVELPRKRVELYQGICKLQLDDRPRARGIPMLLEYKKSQSVLQSLALQMVTDDTLTISRRHILNSFKKHPILQQEAVEAIDFLKQMEQVSELLVEREAEEYEFPHLSFQGYLAATELYNRLEHDEQSSALKTVQQNWNKKGWQETILLLTAQLDPRKFIDVIGSASNQGANAAQLAYDCLREYRKPDKLPPDLKEKLIALTGNVQNQRYQKLEEHLQKGEWQAADKETYRLMITTVGKEEGQWFSSEDLLNFPCEELKAIDGLWVKYSQGRFGFSVQKEIYLSVGGIADGKYNKKTWDKFCHQTGLKKGGRYVPIKYDLNSPLGHLPGGWVEMFFSRIQTCKM
jgi:hypothetical protein